MIFVGRRELCPLHSDSNWWWWLKELTYVNSIDNVSYILFLCMLLIGQAYPLCFVNLPVEPPNFFNVLILLFKVPYIHCNKIICTLLCKSYRSYSSVRYSPVLHTWFCCSSSHMTFFVPTASFVLRGANMSSV